MRYDLYVVTDEAIGRGRSHAELAGMALKGGADAIQLRDKTVPDRTLLDIAEDIRTLTEEAGALFIINDRLDIALASGADGVHLGQQDMPVAIARLIAPRDLIIGVSVRSLDEAIRAEQSGADYLALSPVFTTSSKSDAGAPNGLKTLRSIREACTIPLIAIGGITRENVVSVISAGADGAAVISAVVGEKDVTSAAADLRQLILTARNMKKPDI